jgi:predicted house-cleaning noncanonical NTP pyrophosphatase (MazG superfamily)
MSDDEYRHALLAKLVEEAQEVAAADRDELVKEIADLYEVIDALLVAFDLNREAVLAIQRNRRARRGGFEKRIKLLWTE